MRLRPPKKLWAPKAGNPPDEYEDAARVAYPYRHAPGVVARAAVADGASESAFAKNWAKILADAFVENPLDLSNINAPALTAWLAPAQKQWNAAVPWQRLPWHGQAKARNGAMATLLGVTFQQRQNRRRLDWQAIAVGDCCLFIVNDDTLTLSWPLGHSAQFNNNPPLICSNPANNQGLWPRASQISGECRPGDVMILASDALAHWILREREAGRQPWQTLTHLKPGQEWDDWLQSRRADRAIRNDDATILTIEVQ